MSLSDDWCPSGSEIAPTPVWYENHLRNGRVRWQHKVVAWGLNISRADLYNLQFDLICHFSRSGENLACISLHVKDSDIEEFEKLYKGVAKMYAWVEVSRLWSQEAITQFIRRVRSIVPKLLEASDIDSATGRLSEKGLLAYRPLMTRCPAKLEINIDCLVEIFGLSGLRPKTLKVVARKLGLNDDDQTYLIRNRSDPTFLKELVDKPHELLMMMHDCEVLLSGSRVTTYFWPGFDSSGSDWDFYAHPNVHSWLKFAVYLVSIGVQWTITVDLDNDVMDIYKGFVLSGRLFRNGRYQNVQLVIHWGSWQSSIEVILEFHSSIVQNFICGFGAISMYGYLTTAGLSHAWEPREWFDSKIYEADQEAVNKYVQRGVQYILPNQAAAGSSRVPLPKRRTLSDAGTICVPFDDYIQRCLDESAAKLSSSERPEQERKKQSRLDLIQNDLKLLQNVEWWEISSRLIARQYGDQTVFWDWGRELRAQWADRDKMKHDMQLYVSQFEGLKLILSCAGCGGVGTTRFCQRHDNTSRAYKDLCLAHWNLINYEGAFLSDRVFGSDPDDGVWRSGYDGYPFI